MSERDDVLVLRLRNTLEDRLQGVESQVVEIYLCGHTAYKPPHLGNLRPVVVFDLLIRLLRWIGKEVRYTRNTTDIDDKIIARAKEEGRSIEEITEEATAAHKRSEELLGCAPPTMNPHATGYIPRILQLIRELIDKGVAYESEEHVFFRVNNETTKGNGFYADREGREGESEGAEHKENHADFVLWKPSKPEEPGWPSPYGLGRPGWHTECVAMILGTSRNLTIHGGGCDLRFPHHANELLQLKQCGCMPQMWVHTGMLVDGDGRKMSKSLGNTIDVVQLAEYIPGVILRLALLSTHYRHPLPWTAEKLQQAERLWFKILERIRGSKYRRSEDVVPSQAVIQALCDDLNTPLAFTRLLELSNEELFYTVDFLGLFDATFFPAKASYEEIDKHVLEYRQARESKDYTQSDELRARLEAEGVHVREDYSWFCGLPQNYQRFFGGYCCDEGCERCE